MKKPLSETEPLSLVISSRCKDTILYENQEQSLEVLRRAMKAKLEGITLGGKQVFKVWIHEDESNASALMDNWEECLQKSRDADVFIVLYNGRAGWIGTDSPVKDGVGICHAELSAAFNKAPGKVRSLQFKELVSAKPGSPDEAFQDYVSRLHLPGAQVNTGEEALQRAEELAAAIVLGLAREGVGVNSAGSYYAGEALEWSRLNFSKRRGTMTAAVVTLLRKRHGGAIQPPASNIAAVRIRGSDIGFVCDSVPASMSTAAARELVGQPFLDDPRRTKEWHVGLCGPVHVIACQKNVSESQAVRQLGFPDAIVVKAPFGVYVADDVQKIQMAFIANCRDETTTREGVQAFLNWLNDHGEVQYLVRRARDRRKISDFIRELGNSKGADSGPALPEAARKRAR
jgi:hypothetical protein